MMTGTSNTITTRQEAETAHNLLMKLGAVYRQSWWLLAKGLYVFDQEKAYSLLGYSSLSAYLRAENPVSIATGMFMVAIYRDMVTLNIPVEEAAEIPVRKLVEARPILGHIADQVAGRLPDGHQPLSIEEGQTQGREILQLARTAENAMQLRGELRQEGPVTERLSGGSHSWRVSQLRDLLAAHMPGATRNQIDNLIGEMTGMYIDNNIPEDAIITLTGVIYVQRR